MKYIIIFPVLFLVFIGCSSDPVNENSQGYNMLLIGNSFFRPYAEKLDDLANEAGIDEHIQYKNYQGRR